MELIYNYKFTEAARLDLDEILTYISSTLNNPKAAGDFLKNVKSVIENIRHFPHMGSVPDNEYVTNKNVRKVLIGNYLMYYLPDDNEREIVILRIIYGKRNPEITAQTLNN